MWGGGGVIRKQCVAPRIAMTCSKRDLRCICKSPAVDFSLPSGVFIHVRE